MHGRSGWAINSRIQHQIIISKIRLCERCSYCPLHKELRNPINVLINIQDQDNGCFRRCLVSYLNPTQNISKSLKR